MISITLRHDSNGARSQSRGSAWIAETSIDGSPYQARSHSSTPCALARKLVDAGIPDQPVRATQPGLAGHIEWRSLHTLATRTISESASTPIRAERWQPFSGTVLRGDVSPPDAC
jgi:hypothetical protein